MNCTNCAAPLPSNSNKCKFCNTLNEVDLRSIQRSSGPAKEGERNCPRCDVPLHVVQLQVAGGLNVDQCTQCHGLFFDPGELETVLDESVSHVYEVDFQRLASLAEEEGTSDFKDFSYVRCPDCGEMMNRKSYGPRSGVIVDRCRNHGIWLDGRELNLLLKWTKAGGQIHKHDRIVQEAEMKKLKDGSYVSEYTHVSHHVETGSGFDSSGLIDAVKVILRLIR